MSAIAEAPLFPITYHVGDKDIAAMREKYSGLAINDFKSYETVRLAIADCRTTRVAVEKRRLELNADAQKHIKAVNGAAKVITAAIESIENPLQLMKDTEDNRKAKEKADKEAAERAKAEEEARKKIEQEQAEWAEFRKEEEARIKEENARIEAAKETQRIEREKLEAEKRQVEADRQALEAAKQKKTAKGKKQVAVATLSAADALARLMAMVERNDQTMLLSPAEVAAIKRIIEYVGELEKRLAKVEG